MAISLIDRCLPWDGCVLTKGVRRRGEGGGKVERSLSLTARGSYICHHGDNGERQK